VGYQNRKLDLRLKDFTHDWEIVPRLAPLTTSVAVAEVKPTSDKLKVTVLVLFIQLRSTAYISTIRKLWENWRLTSHCRTIGELAGPYVVVICVASFEPD
jgi:hypothetical protein